MLSDDNLLSHLLSDLLFVFYAPSASPHRHPSSCDVCDHSGLGSDPDSGSDSGFGCDCDSDLGRRTEGRPAIWTFSDSRRQRP